MLKWVSGAKAGKPPKKRPAESEDDLSKSQRIQESKRKYETTRKREYKHSWEKGRPWLSYSGSKMWCAACSGAGLSNAFTSGVSTMKLDSIQSHELSKAHLRSVTAFNAECKGVPEETPASQALISLKQKEAARVGIKFRSAHAVAKHQLSFALYPILCELDQAKGLDVGSSYLNDKACRDFIGYIAQDVNDKTVKTLKESKFFSFTCDGTTDYRGDDYESLYVRSSLRGVVTELFLSVGKAESSCSADICDFIKDTFYTLDLEDTFKNKLVGFCADGASNMQG